MPVARQRGVTLVELMIVITIVGILAVIAVPAYDSFQRKQVLAEGKHCLNTMQSRMEKFFTRNHGYASTLTALGYTDLDAGAYICQIGDDASPDNGYRVTLVEMSDTAGCTPSLCYALQATGYGAQAKDGDLRLTSVRAGTGVSGTPQIQRTRTDADGNVSSW